MLTMWLRSCVASCKHACSKLATAAQVLLHPTTAFNQAVEQSTAYAITQALLAYTLCVMTAAHAYLKLVSALVRLGPPHQCFCVVAVYRQSRSTAPDCSPIVLLTHVHRCNVQFNCNLVALDLLLIFVMRSFGVEQETFCLVVMVQGFCEMLHFVLFIALSAKGQLHRQHTVCNIGLQTLVSCSAERVMFWLMQLKLKS